METRSEHMGPVGTTADILEAQQKEQKVRSITLACIFFCVVCF